MKLSVLMIAYNAEAFFEEAIRSVLHQTYGNFELVIVDDGSTDETKSIAESLAKEDSRIRVHSQPNAGTAGALNNGIALCEGEWIFLMHADDIMHKDRLERQLAFIQNHPELSVASALVRHIDGTGRVIGKDNSTLFTHDAVAAQVKKNEVIGFNHPVVALRKADVLACGGYRQDYWPAEDLDLWNRLVEKGYKILVQPEFLLDYRIHGKAASISRAGLARKKIRWIRDSMIRRRQGQAELNWDQFVAFQKSQGIIKRLNQNRQDMGRIFYKIAVSNFAQRKILATVGNLAMAVMLRPWIITKEVLSKSLWRRAAPPKQQAIDAA